MKGILKNARQDVKIVKKFQFWLCVITKFKGTSMSDLDCMHIENGPRDYYLLIP